MKLKNLAFFGVMASILSVASAQAADPVNPGYIASKGYVDSRFESVSRDLGTNYYTKDEMDTALGAKADSAELGTMAAANTSDYYTKTAADAAFDAAGSATAAETAAKGYTDTKLADYTKTTAMNTALNAKADKSTTYTKTEVDNAIATVSGSVSDIEEIRTNAAAGAGAAETIAEYGDVVTHNAADFATASQGAKADAAAPQSTTYTKTEVNNLLDAKQATVGNGTVNATTNEVVTGVTTTAGVVTAVSSALIADPNVSGTANIAPAKLNLSQSTCETGRTCLLTYTANGNYAATPITNDSDL